MKKKGHFLFAYKHKFIIMVLFCNFFLFISCLNLVTYFILAVLGLHCCAQAFSSYGKWDYPLAVCKGFSSWWLLLSQTTGSRCLGLMVAVPRLCSTGSIIVARGLCCSTARGIFLDQGSNPRLLHWQVDSLPLATKEAQDYFLKKKKKNSGQHCSCSKLFVCLPTKVSLMLLLNF